MALFLFQVVFMETAGYIIIGAIAERISFAGFLCAEIAMGAIIYPIYGIWVWGGGWLAHLGTSLHLGHGAVDFAGSGVVHATGGWAALALAMILGPRIGKFNKDGTPNAIPGPQPRLRRDRHARARVRLDGLQPRARRSAPPTCASRVVAVNTLLAGVRRLRRSAMAWTNAKYGKPDISMSCNGMLAGLVAITAPCAFVAPWAAIVIGIIAGFLVCYSVGFFDHVAHVDDPCGAISVHGVCGAWGVLAVGLFADGTYGDGWNGVPRQRSRASSTATAASSARRSSHVVVGFIWAWGVTWLIFIDRQALHEDPGRRPRSRSRGSTCRVRRVLLPRLRASHATDIGVTTTDARRHGVDGSTRRPTPSEEDSVMKLSSRSSSRSSSRR